MSKGVRSEVMWFANQMEKVLRQKDWKGGWKADSVRALLNSLLDEAEELVVEVKKAFVETRRGYLPGNMPDLIDECVDVANFCMMIADKARELQG